MRNKSEGKYLLKYLTYKYNSICILIQYFNFIFILLWPLYIVKGEFVLHNIE